MEINSNLILLSFIQWAPFVLAFAFGLCVGSFLNVCILRLPEGQSIVRPASRCPRCKTPLCWQDNIPLVSYILLRGRCRKCGKGISWQYPLVEGLTGFYFLLAFWKFQQDFLLLGWALALGGLSILFSGMEIRNHVIPGRILWTFLVLAVLLAPWNPWLGGEWKGRLLQMALGFVAAGCLGIVSLPWLLCSKWNFIRRADIGLMSLLGIGLGWERALGGLFVASILFGLWGIGLWFLGQRKGKATLPLGPFLCIGCLLTVFFPQVGLAHWLS